MTTPIAPLKQIAKVVWTVIAIVGVMVGLWAGYDQYVSKRTSVSAQVVSDINVLDINEPLQDLQILFQNSNIRQENLNLKVYRVKILNNGATNITQGDFDQNDNWGIKIPSATRVIETRIVESNNEYLRENLNPSVVDPTTIRFSKVIFDRDTYFTVEMLVLYPKEITPALFLTGKIAGIKQNESLILEVPKRASFWSEFFSGGWIVNLARILIYFVLSVAVFIGSIVAIATIAERRRKAKQSPQLPQRPSK